MLDPNAKCDNISLLRYTKWKYVRSNTSNLYIRFYLYNRLYTHHPRTERNETNDEANR